jgi:hypothetical protein
MHDLIVLPDIAAGSLTTPDIGRLTEAEVDATMAYAAAEKAASTRKAYTTDWRATSPPGAPPGALRRCQPMSASSPPICPIWPRSG